MKCLTKGILFLCLSFMVLSCSKTVSSPPPKYYSDYQFRVISTDINDTVVNETQIWDFPLTSQNTTVTDQQVQVTDDGGGDDDCHGDNGRTNPKCQSMPVTFDNVSFRRDGYKIDASWLAGVEYDVKSYYILASTDSGKTWTSILSVAPHGEGIQYNVSFSLWTEK